VTSATDSRLEAKGIRKLSAANKRQLIKALAKARKIRWAMTPATRAKLAAAARARWARAEGKTTL